VSDVIESVATPLKGKKSTTVFIIAGALLGLGALFYRQTSAAQSASSTETAAGSPYPQDSEATQINGAMQNFAQALNESNKEMLQTMGDNNQAMLETIAASNEQNAQAFSSLTESMTSALSDLKTSTDNQISNVYDAVHEATYAAASNTTSTSRGSDYQSPSDPARPVVKVVAGSVEEKALRAQYGDKIDIQYAAKNQYQGSDRDETNSRYMTEIARYGVTPVSGVDLWSIDDPYKGQVNTGAKG
jgi:RNA polymerase-binding transcription factor DksA